MQSVVFSAEWFARHQRPLVAALNVPVLGRELRHALGIRQHDVGLDGRIVQLLPHAYVVDHGDGTRTMDVRTHAKYAKRMRHEFAPIWKMAHWFDLRIANPMIPALNLGFDTLTAYPDPGDPGTTTVDGQVSRTATNEAFGTMRAGAGNGTWAAGTQLYGTVLCGSTTNLFNGIEHGVALFNTASIGAVSAILSTVLSLWGVAGNTACGDTTLEVTGQTTASNTTLTVSDYENIGRTAFATSLAISAHLTGQYNDWTLNASGVAAVNKTGVSKFSIQLGWDYNNSFIGTWLSNNNSNMTFSSADATGSANDPKLVVTFTNFHRLQSAGLSITAESWP